MSHQSLRIRPGVDTNATPALNEAGVSASQLIRWRPDPAQGAIAEVLGGWTKFYPSAVGSTVRALWAWADLSANNYLAVGCENQNPVAGISVAVIKGWLSLSSTGTLTDISPQWDNIPFTAPTGQTTAGSPVVTISIPHNGVTSVYTTVFIQTPLAIGGIVLFGLYQCGPVDANHCTVTATDLFGNPLPASSSQPAGTAMALPIYTATLGSAQVKVTLPNHGYSVGSSYSDPIGTNLPAANLTIFGVYPVQSVVDANNFFILASSAAVANDSATMNFDSASYWFSASDRVIQPYQASDWWLDNWGSQLILCPGGVHGAPVPRSAAGPIFEYDPNSALPFPSLLPQAPVINNGAMVVLPQRQIMAWGSSFNGVQDPLLIRWCDIENYGVWIAQSTNQAGSYRLTGGGSVIIAGMSGPTCPIFWTDTSIWVANYMNQPYIWGFNKVASGCGLLAPKAAGVLGGEVYWLSQSQVWQMGAGGIVPVPCPVWDVTFQKIDRTNQVRTRCAANSYFNEITWYFPVVGGTGENSMYVKYRPELNLWDYGTLDRTAWLDQSLFGPPIGAGSNQILYQHETSSEADGSSMASSLTTGYFAVNEGDYKMYVDEVWPDMRWGPFGGTQNAVVDIAFNVVDFPGQTPTTYGPFQLTQTTTFITPRFRGRLVSITIASDPTNTAFWRMGNIRYRAAPDGKY